MRGIVAVTVAALAGLAAPALAQAAELRATVSAGEYGGEIALTDASGRAVTRLDPGTYTIRVSDQSSAHSFHLQGPGVNRATGIQAVGEEVWEVTLADGVYTFFCDVHRTTMRGSFTVGAATVPPAAPTAAKRLVATVGPGFTISLRTASGARVRRLRPGKYRIVVRDRARIHNFHLRGPGVNRATGVSFVGTVTWQVTLRRGTYAFRCDPHRTSLRGTFSVR